MTEKVSLYIPFYNAEKTILHVLTAVLKQTYPIEEIIIVDDGSSCDTKRILADYNVRIIKHEKNMGLAAARNTGIQNAKNEFVASLDADCVPEPGWLEKLMLNFSENKIKGVGGRLLETNTTALPDLWRARHLAQTWGSKKITNPRYLFGNNTVSRKTALMDIGLYNPGYKTNSEDYEISRRLIKNGYKLIYTPAAKVGHIRKDNALSVLDLYCRYYYFGYTRKVNVINVIRGILVNLFFSSSFFIKDLLDCKIALLPLDALSFIFSLKNICRMNLS